MTFFVVGQKWRLLTEQLASNFFCVKTNTKTKSTKYFTVKDLAGVTHCFAIWCHFCLTCLIFGDLFYIILCYLWSFVVTYDHFASLLNFSTILSCGPQQPLLGWQITSSNTISKSMAILRNYRNILPCFLEWFLEVEIYLKCIGQLFVFFFSFCAFFQLFC